jgi:hypothetical protein
MTNIGLNDLANVTGGGELSNAAGAVSNSFCKHPLIYGALIGHEVGSGHGVLGAAGSYVACKELKKKEAAGSNAP